MCLVSFILEMVGELMTSAGMSADCIFLPTWETKCFFLLFVHEDPQPFSVSTTFSDKSSRWIAQFVKKTQTFYLRKMILLFTNKEQMSSLIGREKKRMLISSKLILIKHYCLASVFREVGEKTSLSSKDTLHSLKMWIWSRIMRENKF